jgi:hypothetical protein
MRPHAAVRITVRGLQTEISLVPAPSEILQYQVVRWWAHKDSNLGPAD